MSNGQNRPSSLLIAILLASVLSVSAAIAQQPFRLPGTVAGSAKETATPGRQSNSLRLPSPARSPASDETPADTMPIKLWPTVKPPVQRRVSPIRDNPFAASTPKPQPLPMMMPAAVAPRQPPAQTLQPSDSPENSKAGSESANRESTNRIVDQTASKPATNASSQQPTPDTQVDCDRPPVHYNDFSPTPVPAVSMVHDPMREAYVYDAKRSVPTQHPWIEWGRIFYGDGITPRGQDWFGQMNMVRSEFYVYGDYRIGLGSGRNAGGRADNLAARLNLDMDWQLTDTERLHAFMGPLDKNNQFNRIELIDGDLQYEPVFDPNLVTFFFEGDLGAMAAGLHDMRSPFELPITVGLIPLLFQNGVWMEDAVTGAAIALPAKHSRLLNWANYDWTFFAVVDQLNSPAFGADKHAAQAFGTAMFIDAYDGYIEAGYAYLRDRTQSERSYHNMTVSFTRRYFDRISNSVRLIVNTGQDLRADLRTADGGLLLVENSWVTDNPLRVVPYANFFFGWDRPQSVARAGAAGGILRNTGINFDTDGLNGLATLDPTASDTTGFSIGVDLIGQRLDRQWLLEFSYLTPHGNRNLDVPDDQYGVGTRYQFPISHRSLLRFDVVYGWRRQLEDVYGTRAEYRWKF
ncbi:hypothetical protein [Crateriforma spongiae]|uniref:hypothetical protein n=1 Tax=Crateriforma spongiae TaxID=2724528 RepID=UPI001F279255|nr:hypothetical protein [Crateriforma spongiae]